MSALLFWCEGLWRSLRHFRPIIVEVLHRFWLLPEAALWDVWAAFDPASKIERDQIIARERRRWERVDEENAPRGV